MIFRFLIALLIWTQIGLAQEGYSALSRFIPNGSYARDVVFSGTEIRIQHTQGVPFRVYTLDAPKRLIVEFNAVTFAGLEEEVFSRSQSITGVRAGALKSGWSRMVFDLARPMSVDSAGVTVALETAQAELIIRLTKTDEDRFADEVKALYGKSEHRQVKLDPFISNMGAA